MNTQEAASRWFDYVDRYFRFIAGPKAGGSPVKAVRHSLESGKMYIHMSDGTKIEESRMDEFVIYDDSIKSGSHGDAYFGDVKLGESAGPPPSYMNNDPLGGYDGGLMSPEEEEAENRRRLQNEENLKAANEKAKEESKPQHPIVLLLSNMKDLETNDIIVNFKLDMIGKDAFDLLDRTFQDNTAANILEYYLSKISTDSIRDSLVESLEEHIINKYKLDKDAFKEPEPEEEVHEGTIVSPRKETPGKKN